MEDVTYLAYRHKRVTSLIFPIFSFWYSSIVAFNQAIKHRIWLYDVLLRMLLQESPIYDGVLV